jgi:hypothetical protein
MANDDGSFPQFLLDALLPEPEACRLRAQELLSGTSGNPREAAERAVATAQKWLAVAGAGSGLVANPLAMVPAAATEMAFVLQREAQLTGVIAAILDPQSLSDRDSFQADVLAIMFPSAASQALREIAVLAGQHTTKVLIRKYISKDILKAIIKFAAKYLGIKLTQRAIITKMIPFVGGVIGATWNWAEVRSVGNRAIKYHVE